MNAFLFNGELAISDTGKVYRKQSNGELRELTQSGIGRGNRYRCVKPKTNQRKEV